MSSTAPALLVDELVVHYGPRLAVDRVSLALAPGEIVGLLGPNGAGKSTLLLAAAGAVLPTAGAVTIAGHALAGAAAEAKAHVGLADQPPSLYEFFTVAEHLGFVAEARGGAGAGQGEALLDALGLAAVAQRPCRELSFGMRQRVGLAAALVGDVRVVLLDETLNGLDPHATRRATEVIERAAAGGAAVLLSTHLLGVAERVCHRVLLMDQGRLVDERRRDGDAPLSDRVLEQLYVERIADRGVV
ncbi:MAG: ATP-binding cassette domain-containing protein [Kofleriaceae bacterium]